MSEPGLTVTIDRVTRRFGTRTVLDRLDLRIGSGEFVAVVGRSGCGKSTLLRLLAGLDRPDGGRIALGDAAGREADDREADDREADDREADDRGAGDRGAVRIMFQEARLLPWKTVIDNVALGLPRERLDHARAVLDQVGLAERGGDWPAVLSGGQRQRVALARALVHDPRLLLLDEPLGALDALTRIEMQVLVESLWARNAPTAVLVTHDVAEAVTLADRVIVLDAGRVALDIDIDLPRPRSRSHAGFADCEARLLSRLLERAA